MAKLSRGQKGQLLDLLTEVTRVTVNGVRPFGAVREELQRIIEGRFTQVTALAYPDRDYSRYDKYLLPLEAQLELLRELNKRLPSGLRVTDAWLDLDTASEHDAQSVVDLEHWFVVLDTLEATLAFNWELIKLTQPAHYHSGFDTDAANLQLGPNTRWYQQPGIYRVWVNLVDNWDPEKGRTVDQIRARVAGTNILLASVEPVAAYGLHSELFRQQDGVNLPYADLAGLRQGRGLGQVPCLFWGGGASLGSFSSGGADWVYAAPSLQGVQRN